MTYQGQNVNFWGWPHLSPKRTRPRSSKLCSTRDLHVETVIPPTEMLQL